MTSERSGLHVHASSPAPAGLLGDFWRELYTNSQGFSTSQRTQVLVKSLISCLNICIKRKHSKTWWYNRLLHWTGLHSNCIQFHWEELEHHLNFKWKGKYCTYHRMLSNADLVTTMGFKACQTVHSSPYMFIVCLLKVKSRLAGSCTSKTQTILRGKMEER